MARDVEVARLLVRSARQAALKAGLPATTSATTINRVCGSGLKAIMLAAAEIRAGDADVVVAGGMENMDLAPFLLPNARFGYRLGDATLVDEAVHDGLWCAFEDCHMGTARKRVAIQFHVTGRWDACAETTAGHRRRRRWVSDGLFDHRPRRGARGRWSSDETPRDTSLEALAASKPAFALPTEPTAAARPRARYGGNAPGHRRRGGDGVASGPSGDTASPWPGSWATPGPRSGGGCSSPGRGRPPPLDRVGSPWGVRLMRSRPSPPGPSPTAAARVRIGEDEREQRSDRPQPSDQGDGARVVATLHELLRRRGRTGSPPSASAVADGPARWPSSASREPTDGLAMTLSTPNRADPRVSHS
jgi:hypothetical protein